MHKRFNVFLKEHSMKLTTQRMHIAEVFFDSTRHLSTEELYDMVKKKYPRIGYATVFRTLKLFCDAKIARPVDFGDRIVRFEQTLDREHHGHLVCVKCGRCIEAVDHEIKKLQDRLAKKFSFEPTGHKMQIYGICKRCRKKKRNSK